MKVGGLSARDYEQDPPSGYVLKLIEDHDPDGMFLAQKIKEMEHFGILCGQCIKTTYSPSAQLWVIDGSSHKLIYAFITNGRKIFYLIALKAIVRTVFATN